MLKFIIKLGNTSCALRSALMPDSVSLAGTTVRFQMRARGGSTVIDRPTELASVVQSALVTYPWAPV